MDESLFPSFTMHPTLTPAQMMEELLEKGVELDEVMFVYIDKNGKTEVRIACVWRYMMEFFIRSMYGCFTYGFFVYGYALCMREQQRKNM